MAGARGSSLDDRGQEERSHCLSYCEFNENIELTHRGYQRPPAPSNLRWGVANDLTFSGLIHWTNVVLLLGLVEVAHGEGDAAAFHVDAGDADADVLVDVDLAGGGKALLGHL